MPFGEPFKEPRRRDGEPRPGWARSRTSAPRAPSGTSSRKSSARPFEGLPHWLSSRTEDRGFLADIATLEADVHEHKVFDIREPALLEHRHGYAFLRSGLVQESLTYWQLDTGPTPKGFRDYLAWLINEDSITFLPRAVSLRARWEGNFWHLHDNVLSKLIAIDELDLPDDVPLLVGRPLWESRYFAELRTMPAFRDRNWMLHDRPIRTDRMIVMPRGLVPQGKHGLRAPEPRRRARRAHRRRHPDLLFLSREAGIERHLDNEPALTQQLAPRGFTTLRAERLSLTRTAADVPRRALRRVAARRRTRQCRAPHRPAHRHRRALSRRQGIRAAVRRVAEPGVRLHVPGGGGEPRDVARQLHGGSRRRSGARWTPYSTSFLATLLPLRTGVREFLHLPRIGRSRHRRQRAALPRG